MDPVGGLTSAVVRCVSTLAVGPVGLRVVAVGPAVAAPVVAVGQAVVAGLPVDPAAVGPVVAERR